jgi:hypothetical protein
MVRIRLCCLALVGMLLPAVGLACSVSRVETPTELVTGADIIVRAVATHYQTPPADPHTWTTGVPDSVVSFNVVEVVRGTPPLSLALHGYLVQGDDFNDHESPYTFVRPGGRAGSCFANSYKPGAEYLLFLKETKDSSELTVNWAALAPVNEQLHDDHDPWLLWVRTQAKSVRK